MERAQVRKKIKQSLIKDTVLSLEPLLRCPTSGQSSVLRAQRKVRISLRSDALIRTGATASVHSL